MGGETIGKMKGLGYLFHKIYQIFPHGSYFWKLYYITCTRYHPSYHIDGASHKQELKLDGHLKILTTCTYELFPHSYTLCFSCLFY